MSTLSLLGRPEMALPGFGWSSATPKPEKGSGLLARESATAARKAKELEVGKAVKARDGGRCRWPEAHKCRGGLEAAHIIDKSLGGETSTSNEIALCAWIHRRGPQSIHGKQLLVTTDSPRGANGPCSFWQKDERGWFMVARETSCGVVEKD